MKFKTKLVSILTLFVVVFSFMIVGVFAVKTTNFNVGGNINFRATGINAVISQGSLNNALWVDESEAENKLKEIILNTYKTGEEIEEEFLSWQGLNLMFNENGDDATITFSITNTSEHEEYFSVNASVNQGTSTNATVDITPKMVELAPGKSQDYTITFSITDSEINASILDFKIDLDMQLINLLTASEYPTLTFSYNNTNYTASVKANTSNKPTGDLVLPSFVKYNNVVYEVSSITDATSSSRGAFYNCTGLTSITIPNSITSIGSYAFHSCTGLSSMNYLGDINEWVSISFGNVYSSPTFYTKSININGKAVIDVVIDKAISINTAAFHSCKDLKSLKLGNQLKTIESLSFFGCSGLTGEVIIPEGVTTIGTNSFYGCSGLTGELVIPDSVLTIDSGAFSGCSGLTSVKIGNGLSNLSNNTFYSCSGLVNIEIGKSVSSIGDNVFYNCSRITSVNYLGNINSWVNISFSQADSNPTYYSKSLKINGEIVTDVVIDTATSINAYAFIDCSTLTSVTIGNQVTTINTSAFYNCTKLTTVIIDSATIAGALSSKDNVYICGGLIAKATAIYVKTDIVGSLNSYVTTNYPNVTVYNEGEYAGYTLYSK